MHFYRHLRGFKERISQIGKIRDSIAYVQENYY